MKAKPERALLALLVLSSACASPGAYVWADDYRTAPEPEPGAKGYVIRPGDVVNVRVFNQDQMSGRERVRGDGKVSLPFLNDVVAAGYTPQDLAAQLQTRLKDFINAPVVTVSVDEEHGVPVTVGGEVMKPGLYALQVGAGVLQALVQAGGLTEFANRSRIFLLRPEAPGQAPVRIRFEYRALVRAEGRAGLFQLKPGDSVVVE